MENGLYLSILAQSTSTKNPTFKVFADSREIVGQQISQIDTLVQRHLFMIDGAGLSKISVQLLNKEPNDTKVVDDDIVEDLLLIIESITLDQIDLTNLLPKISIYKTDQGQVVRSHNYISWNGIFTIKIHQNLLYTEWLASML